MHPRELRCLASVHMAKEPRDLTQPTGDMFQEFLHTSNDIRVLFLVRTDLPRGLVLLGLKRIILGLQRAPTRQGVLSVVCLSFVTEQTLNLIRTKRVSLLEL